MQDTDFVIRSLMPLRVVAFRTSPQLIDAARKRAARENTTLSEIMRLLLADYAAARTSPLELARELYAFRRELNAVVINLNQLTRGANMGMLDLGELRPVLARLTALVTRALEALKRNRRIGTRRSS